jgi:hypothetical protein
VHHPAVPADFDVPVAMRGAGAVMAVIKVSPGILMQHWRPASARGDGPQGRNQLHFAAASMRKPNRSNSN